MALSPQANLQGIANELNISIATVSRALRGVPGINEDTRRKVLETASAQGYSKHVQKEMVKTHKNPRRLYHVLVLSESSLAQNDLRYMSGMSEAAVDANLAILSHMVTHDRCASVLDSRTAPSSLRAGLVKGVILLHRWPLEVARALAEKMPTVSIVHDYPGCNIDFIGVDERQSMIELVSHLRAGGHRRIGFFGFCRDVSWACSRNAAYFEALIRSGLPYDPADTITISLEQAVSSQPFTAVGWGDVLLGRIRQGVDAWICPSSMTVLSLQRFLISSGLNVPQDVALTGFHRGIFSASNDVPNFTTTAVADEELGLVAIRRLLARMVDPRESRRAILMPARMIIGESTRPPL